MRFGALRRLIEGVSQKMLTKTLRKLEGDGLVHRQVYDEMPLRVEHTLTPLGQECARLVNKIELWAEENMDEIGRANNSGDETRPL
ncbi:MAG: helix-turn-helix domain-containing protein [Pseudomonadota bacterium]